MATNKHDAAAAKAKKQKLILVIGGVLLIGLGAIQGPKLLKGSSPAAEPATSGEVAAPTTVTAGTVSTPAGGTATVAKVSTGPRPTAILAGVTIQSGGAPAIDAGQLLRFNLFEAKDPFVPQTSDELSGTTEPTAEPTLSDTEPGTSGSTDAAAPTGSSDSAAEPASPPAATTNATIIMNGKAYYLAPAMLVPLGAGAVCAEGWLAQPRVAWLRSAAAPSRTATWRRRRACSVAPGTCFPPRIPAACR